MKVATWLSFVLISTMLVVAGCGGTPSSRPDAGATPEKTPAPEVAKPKEIVKVSLAVGGKSSILYLPPALAESAGFFKDEKVEITVEDLKGGAQAAQALVAGQVDFASIGLEHGIKAQAQGVDVVMLVLYNRYPSVTLIVDSRLKDKVKSISDLKGMKVGVTSPGSATHKALISLVDKFGLKASDVEVVGIGTNTMPAALESGKVQAAVGLDPWVTQMLSSGKAYSLWDLRTKKDTEALYGGEYAFAGLATRREVIQKNPELVQRVVQAVVKANRFIASNSPENITAKLPADIKGEDEALYLASLRANMEAFSPDGLASDKGVQVVIDSLKQDKVIPETVEITPSKVFDPSFTKKVK